MTITSFCFHFIKSPATTVIIDLPYQAETVYFILISSFHPQQNDNEGGGHQPVEEVPHPRQPQEVCHVRAGIQREK